MKRARLTALLWPCLIVTAGFLHSLAAEDVPQPVDLGTRDVSAYLAVPNLTGVLDKLDTVGVKFNPQMKQGTYKFSLGMILGDPQLANLDAGKPIVAMLFKTPPSDNPVGPPPFALFIPAKAAAPFDQAFTRMQMVSAYSNGVLIVAQTADALTQAQAQIGAYQKIAEAKISGDVRLFASMANLMDSYGPVIQKGMDGFMQQLNLMGSMKASAAGTTMDPQTLGKIAAGEMKIFAETFNQFDSLQYEFTLKDDVVAVDTLFSAKKGSPLADLLAAPPAGPNKALLLLTKPGSLSGSARINPEGYKNFTTRMISTLMKDPTFADANLKDLQEFITNTMGSFSGDLAMTLDSAPGGGLSMESVMTITDEKKYLDVLDQISKLMSADGSVGKFYASMGMKMEMTLQKAVRQHAGVDVHRVKTTFDTSKMPPAQAAQMKAMAKDADVALVKGYYLASYDPAELDKMIDKALATTALTPDVSLESITAFGEGKQAYFDVDMIGFMKASLSAMPANPMSGMFSQIKSKSPTLMAATYGSGRALMQARISLAPFIEMATLARKARSTPPPPSPLPPGGNGAENPKDEKF